MSVLQFHSHATIPLFQCTSVFFKKKINHFIQSEHLKHRLWAARNKLENAEIDIKLRSKNGTGDPPWSEQSGVCATPQLLLTHIGGDRRWWEGGEDEIKFHTRN